MLAKLRTLWKKESFRKAVYIFIIAKILVLAAGYAGYFLIPAENTSRKQITEPLMNPWAQYDGRAYLDVAQNGYNAQFNAEGNYGFYPLYPLLIKIFSFAGYDTAAFLLSNVFSLLAVAMLYIIAEEEYGEKIARKAITYLVLFPTAYFLSVMYAESLFIFLSVLTFYYARKGNWLAAGAAGFFASLTRLQGVLLLVPVAYLYAHKIKFDLHKIKLSALAALLIPAGTTVFSAYLYFITGDAFIGSKAFATQGKYFAMPWTTLHNEMINFTITVTKGKIYILFNVAVATSMVVLCFLSRKYVKAEYTIYMVVSTLLPLFSGSLEAISRYALSVFPFFILLPLLEEKNKKLRLAMKIALALSIILLVVLTIRHVNMHLDPYGL